MALITLLHTRGIRLVFLTKLLSLISLHIVLQTLYFPSKKYRESKSNSDERHNGGCFTITEIGYSKDDLLGILVRPLLMISETLGSLAILCTLALA